MALLYGINKNSNGANFTLNKNSGTEIAFTKNHDASGIAAQAYFTKSSGTAIKWVKNK